MGTDIALRDELTRVAHSLGVEAIPGGAPVIERPRDPSFGDWATNLAMVLAKPLSQSPRKIAEQIVAALDRDRVGISSAEIAGPGFINFKLSSASLSSSLMGVIAAGAAFGKSDEGRARPVDIEFVSANPTGPLHVGHGRQAALGDAIASLLEWTGWRVTREFYYNDAGVQIHNLALSVQARVRELHGLAAEIPEGGYHGDYIKEIAQQYIDGEKGDANADDLDRVQRFAVAALRGEQDKDLQAFGVKFDLYFLESSLYSDAKVDRAVKQLVGAGHTFEGDGALWLRTTDFADDKDRVMRKRDGTYTYFVPDVAYHVDKWERGFARAINVQGADHHSTVTRVRAGLQALEMGIPADYPEYVLHQMVTVMKDGQEVKISKRAGSYVTVRDVVDQVGRDAVRYFFLMRKGDSQLTFDIDLAKSQSEENPVYYVQMAHARLAGIFRVGGIDAAAITGTGVDLAVLTRPEEIELIKALADFPNLVRGAAEALEPHRIATYLHELAGRVHLWYHTSHVLNEPERVRDARLVLARASQIVLRNGFALLGISAPDRM